MADRSADRDHERMTETTTRPLRRSSTDKIVGGVAGGLARYLGVDPAIVRIVLALTMFLGGIGFVAYVLAWILLPVDSADDPAQHGRPPSSDGLRILGAVLVFVAAASVLDDAWWAGELLLPVALIAVGGWLIFRPDRGRTDDQPDAPGGGDPDDRFEHAPQHEIAVGSPGPAQQHPADVSAPPPAPKGFPTARATAGVMALTGGGLWLAASNGADISLEAALVIVLAICGAGLVVGSVVGRARPLIALAVPLMFAVVAASAIDVPLEGGVGDRAYTPADSSELEDEYRLGMGEMVLDLRDLDLDALRGTRTEIEASVGMGSLQVLVPRDLTVQGSARAQVGDVDVRGESQSGTSAEQQIRIAGEEGAGVLELDLRVGVGEVRVR